MIGNILDGEYSKPTSFKSYRAAHSTCGSIFHAQNVEQLSPERSGESALPRLAAPAAVLADSPRARGRFRWQAPSARTGRGAHCAER